ncbi:MAG: Methylated-DNA--protein-cysteine methyltransferase [Candidatus Thorarchaeota archaeon AB_25]|nr:MAG: Methylated-DNA--protein-cysteine methyltransferase [Candidatus Thorarchaeota archaeon AB_25]
MSERVLALLKKDGKYIAGVFTSQGLYTSSLPCDIKSDAVKDVNGGSLRREDTDERMMALETVYAVHEGSKDAAVHDINLDFAGFTPKQVAVLKVVMKIPFGSTMSYGDVAKKAGLPGAARFVGNVMRINRLGPVIPCHRVVSSTGLGGYTGGIDKKIDLLAREGVIRGDFTQKALHRIP